MTRVAIVGIGMHEFGRTDGVSGLDQGAVAVRRALADAGLGWEDVQFAVGGSAAAGAADSLVSRLGLTGLQFTNVSNGCATGGTALFTAATAIMAGTYDIGIAVGFDKHERGAFRVDTQAAGLGEWYGSERPGPHDPVLRHEDQPLHARIRHHARGRSRRWRRRPSATGR